MCIIYICRSSSSFSSILMNFYFSSSFQLKRWNNVDRCWFLRQLISKFISFSFHQLHWLKAIMWVMKRFIIIISYEIKILIIKIETKNKKTKIFIKWKSILINFIIFTPRSAFSYLILHIGGLNFMEAKKDKRKAMNSFCCVGVLWRNIFYQMGASISQNGY